MVDDLVKVESVVIVILPNIICSKFSRQWFYVIIVLTSEFNHYTPWSRCLPSMTLSTSYARWPRSLWPPTADFTLIASHIHLNILIFVIPIFFSHCLSKAHHTTIDSSWTYSYTIKLLFERDTFINFNHSICIIWVTSPLIFPSFCNINPKY